MRIIKKANETAEKAQTRTQNTNHGWSPRMLNCLTKDTSLSTHGNDWDIQISGEGPGKRGTKGPGR